MDAAALRACFPVFERVAYLNAGSCGPVAGASVRALGEECARWLEEGRGKAYFERLQETHSELRSAYAEALGAAAADVALTASTSDGIVRVLLGLGLSAGDEVLIAEHEHPGLLGPLAAAREQLGLEVRAVPLAEIAGAVGPRTRLVACSHIGWTTGELAPPLGAVPDDVPVLLDGAQGAGAVPVEPDRLGCAFYAGSGQKWLCGPVGTGMLWVAPAWRRRLRAAGPTYPNLEEPGLGLGARPWPDARAYDAPALSAEVAVAARAAVDVLASHGWDDVHARARSLAGATAEGLRAAGREVGPRGETTLVSWRSDAPEDEVARLLESGVVVRSFAGLPWVRASLGAWSDQDDVDRLLAAIAG